MNRSCCIQFTALSEMFDSNVIFS